jgi:hypothetical protein
MKRMIPPTIGFLLLTAVMLAFAIAHRNGVVDATVAFRGIGTCVALMAIVTGNFLPKLRPLGATAGDVDRVAAAERRAGWLLVLMGLALAGVFLLAPVALARWIAPVVALGGVGLIELDWIWTVWITRPASGENVRAQGAPARERRRIAGSLLFGLAYVLVTASLKFISEDTSRLRSLGAWSVVGFAIAYSVFIAVVDFRRRGWHAR